MQNEKKHTSEQTNERSNNTKKTHISHSDLHQLGNLLVQNKEKASHACNRTECEYDHTIVTRHILHMIKIFDANVIHLHQKECHHV